MSGMSSLAKWGECIPTSAIDEALFLDAAFSDERRDILHREASVVAQALQTDKCRALGVCAPVAFFGSGTRKPGHKSNDSAGEGVSGACVLGNAEEADRYRKYLIRAGWTEEDR